MRLTLPQLVGALSPLPLLLACASMGGTGHDSNVITAPELARSRSATAYDAVRSIRPEMLRNRQPGSLQLWSSSNPVIAVDNTLIGGVDVLRGIPTAHVARIEYLNSWKAGKKYGVEARDGIVLVATRADSAAQLSIKEQGSARPRYR
jgi:hypothetical protein